MKINFKLSAFADESGEQLTQQIQALKRNEIKHIEIRGVNGNNISDLTVSETKEIAKMLSENSIIVSAIGSPIGKVSINSDLKKETERLKDIAEKANILGTDKIRIFSFYDTNEKSKEKVLEQLFKFQQTISETGVKLCHENEKGIYGDTPEKNLEIVENIPEIKLVFDPANYIQCNINPKQAWDMLKNHVEYLHIKDAVKTGEVVPAGQGIGRLDAIIYEYKQMGKSLLSLEPHLIGFVGYDTLEEGHLLQHKYKFESNEDAFDFAADTLKKLIQTI